MRYRYAARVMYDGSNYHGWQDQDKHGRTVQRTLRTRLTERFGTVVTATGASRTDQGVHSHGQAVHFDAPKLVEDVEQLQYSLNRILPDDIRIYNVSHCPLGTPDQISANEPWHATKSATGKLYIYRFCVAKWVDPMRRRYCAHFYLPTDIPTLKHCLSLCVGTHDFCAFTNRVTATTAERSQQNQEYSTIRTIHSIDVIDEGDGYYRAEFRIGSATYRMIRNIMGTATAVAIGRDTVKHMEQMLSPELGLTRRDNKAMSASPEGLMLEHVYYDHY